MVALLKPVNTYLNMKTKEKALIKDLELQIDYLISYQPQGLHWKQEYHFRKNLLESTLAASDTPPEIVEKINTILDTIFRLRNKTGHEQNYIDYTKADYIIERPIKVRKQTSEGLKEWYI